MRRLAILLIPFVLLAGLGWPPHRRAEAQAQPAVALTLLSKSAWSGPERPLNLSFRARNLSGTRLDSLTVVLKIEPPAGSRSEYELSLQQSSPTILDFYHFEQEGGLPANGSRVFDIRGQLLDVLASGGVSGVYPLEVQLQSAYELVGAMRVPMIFFAETPELPLNLAWTWVLHAPVQFAPDGTFVSDSLEKDVSAGGRLNVMVEALGELRRKPFAADVAVSPALVGQLARMAGGYRIREPAGTVRSVAEGTGGAARADRLLTSLRRALRNREVDLLALPYGDASLPVLIQSRVGKDFKALLERGRDAVKRVLGKAASSRVYRPPFSQLEPASLARLAALGLTTVLLDAGTVPRPPDLYPSPAPVVRLTGRGRSLAAVVPDAGVARLAGAYRHDPRLAAHAALGELAAIYFESPGISGRAAAVVLPERPTYSPQFVGAFSGLVRHSPWLNPVRASSLAEAISEPETVPVPPRRYQGFSPEYSHALARAKKSLDQFALAVPDADPVIDELRANLLLAKSTSFVSNPELGARFIASVRRTIAGVFAKVRPPDPSIPFTLTSRSGFIPVRVTNDTGYRLRARIRLAADRSLVFPAGNVTRVTLPNGSETLLFRVRPQTTGRFPVKIIVETPGGAPIAETRVVVRSTAYSRIAMFLTIGAAVFLLAWWGRRFLPRRRP